MSTTIFCTFEQQDLADLAMGHIRKIPGVKSIHYVVENHAQQGEGATNGVMTGWGWFGIDTLGTGQTPSLPTGVKICCEDASKQKVVYMLVNLHAYRIVTTP